MACSSEVKGVYLPRQYDIYLHFNRELLRLVQAEREGRMEMREGDRKMDGRIEGKRARDCPGQSLASTLWSRAEICWRKQDVRDFQASTTHETPDLNAPGFLVLWREGRGAKKEVLKRNVV